METKGKLILAAGGTTLLLSGCIAFGVRKKKQDRKSALFYSELERKISPASVGLVESDAFDIHYWENLMKTLKKSYYLMTITTAKNFATDIESAWGFFNDDEDKVFGAFRAVKDQVAVSQIANQYYLKKKINLIDDLRSRMPESVGEVLKIVNKLPPYRLPATK